MAPQYPKSDESDIPWVPVSICHGTALAKGQARNWALVLDSRGIPCSIDTDGAGWLLLVPEPQRESAQRELQLYESANRNWPPAGPAARQLIENTLPTISVLILLASFHNLTLIGLTLPRQGFVDLRELGTAHAASIMAGQWWQCLTALTLHADFIHLLSNTALGGIFIILLCRELGSGLAWFLLLAAGSSGNFLNAWLQAPEHHSVGASTAVFGAVGLLTAISSIRYRHHLQRRWFVPAAAGLALLAILGTEGKQTDLGAHLSGFVMGTVFGAGAEYMVGKSGRPGPLLNALLALLSIALVLTAWWAAVKLG